MMAADLLHASVHRIVPSGVSFCWPLSRCRAYSADAFALHFALSHGLHLGLHSAQPTNVQMPCREHGRSVAVAVFASALAACAAAPPGRSCREWMREANAEGKTKGGGTGPPAKPVCTWGWRGTRHKAASCRQQPQCLASIGNTVCRIRSGAMGLSGATS